MTAAQLRVRDGRYDGQGDLLLPIGTFGAQVFVFFSLMYAFNVTGFEVFPGVTPLGLVFGAFGVLVLAPRVVAMRIPVSLLALCLLAWIMTSTMWTDNPVATSRAIQNTVPLLVGMVICAGMISLRDLVPALLWMIRVSVLITIAVLIVYPETRYHIDLETGTRSIDGWHGWFPHKNIMTPFLTFALLTVLTFDRSVVGRYLTLAAIAALLLGSDSVTGMAGALLAVSIWVWLQLYKNLDIRGSSIFLVSSIAVGLFAVLGAAASLATLTSASGKDITFTGRTLIWAASLDAIRDRPIQGYGFGGPLSDDPVTPLTAEIWRAIGFAVPHAHSGPIDALLQIGVIGLLLFLALYVTTMVDALRMVRERPAVAAWIVSTLVVQLFISFSENVFLGTGWLPTLFLFRTVLSRTHGMDLDTGTELADRVRTSLASGRPVVGEVLR